MITLQRLDNNPIVEPNPQNEWEYDGAFNGSVAYTDGIYHMVYRALSSTKEHQGQYMQVSSIGYATSEDGIHFTNHRQLISPTEDWERYGCEDPRITYMDGKFYIFYTALSTYPFGAEGIKLAVAITKDFQEIEKHPATTFNSKAMALFPEKINGKLAALLTMDTDLPPAKISLALFDKEEDMWSPDYWNAWHDTANDHILHLLRNSNDQVELGAPPIKTKYGWLVIYSYINDYLSSDKSFGIEAVLLDIHDPRKILGRTSESLLIPEEEYELQGVVPNVVFPSGALVKDGKLFIYYGAADTRVALAKCDFALLTEELKESFETATALANKKFTRYEGNPILTPAIELAWQKMAVFNPAAIYEDGKIHIIYRAQSAEGTSVFGYASSKDGFHIDENLNEPIYIPREDFEKKTNEKGNSGCEDPRITKIDDRFFMTYTAYDGANPPRVAMTSIAISDFLNKKWNWTPPKLISPPGVDDKDACIVKNIKGSGYLAFHRLGEVIWIDILRDLEFPEDKFLSGGILAHARKDKWDNVKVGISTPPIETEHGWLLFYHGVSHPRAFYKVGAMLLDYDDPKKILARSEEPLLEPEKPYELIGQVSNVVFPCGVVVIDGTVFLYYGGADTVVGVATMPLQSLLNTLLKK